MVMILWPIDYFPHAGCLDSDGTRRIVPPLRRQLGMAGFYPTRLHRLPPDWRITEIYGGAEGRRFRLAWRDKTTT